MQAERARYYEILAAVCGRRDGAVADAMGATVPVVSGTRETTVASAPAAPVPAVVMIETAADFEAALPALMAAPAVGLDIETVGLDPTAGRLRLVQLAVPDWTFVVDCSRVAPNILVPILDGACRIVGQNLKFDLGWLLHAGLPVPHGDRLFDTMLGAQLVGAGTAAGTLKQCGLAALAERFLGENLDKTLQASDWAGMLTREQLEYAARDAAVLLPLARRLRDELHRADLGRVAELEMRALPAVVWLERSGAPFDADRWAALSDRAVAEQVRLEAALTETAGAVDLLGASTVKWSSQPQILKLLRGRGHDVSGTDEVTLTALAETDPLARLLLEYRETGRRASAYGIEFLHHVSPASGRIHADYLQLGARSGRMSCTRPNLQNIPRDPAYRACFRPRAGRVLVKADYSQIELRIAAEITGDERMLDAYRSGEDLHAVTAAAVLGRTDGAVSKADRQAAKALNFGLIFGMGAARLRDHAASGYGVAFTEDEAVRFRDRFFETYPGLRRWHRRQPNGRLITRTLAGRRRGVEKFTEKVNTPIQGSAADGMKAALALLWETRDRCPGAVPVLCVHDEVVLECDAADAERVRDWLVECMTRGMASFLKQVPVVVEATIAADWSGAEVLPRDHGGSP